MSITINFTSKGYTDRQIYVRVNIIDKISEEYLKHFQK